jgi:microcystin-dependent protein
MEYPLLATIVLFAGNFAPKGGAFCDGSLQSIQQNQALFSLLGTTYGGDGTSNFALPDLRSKAPVPGSHYIIALQGRDPERV